MLIDARQFKPRITFAKAIERTKLSREEVGKRLDVKPRLMQYYVNDEENHPVPYLVWYCVLQMASGRGIKTEKELMLENEEKRIRAAIARQTIKHLVQGSEAKAMKLMSELIKRGK
jgi:hypothetical protein